MFGLIERLSEDLDWKVSSLGLIFMPSFLLYPGVWSNREAVRGPGLDGQLAWLNI